MKTVIFDFGNVVGLFDHRLTLDRLAPYTDLSADEMFARVYQGSLETEIEKGLIDRSEILRRVHDLWQLRCDVEFLAHSIANIFTPNPEVCALIPQLRPRYRILLGSNTNDIHACHFRKQFAEVLSHFDALVLSCEIGQRKPEAGFYEHCQQHAQAAAHEIVFVDDLHVNIEAARAHGWHGIVYRPGEGLAQKLRALGVVV
jgi:HAD superfamily hydrolase (TIGR01509 family)